MVRLLRAVPLDYSLCDQTVTVYRREGLTRHVIHGAYYDFKDTELAQEQGEAAVSFLLIVPGRAQIAPGDKVMPGVGPEAFSWAALNPAEITGLGVVKSVSPKHFGAGVCHTEVRG